MCTCVCHARSLGCCANASSYHVGPIFDTEAQLRQIEAEREAICQGRFFNDGSDDDGSDDDGLDDGRWDDSSSEDDGQGAFRHHVSRL